MGRFVDISGHRFGHLTAIERADVDCNGSIRWACMCDCGTEKVILGTTLRRGQSNSCGCLTYKMASEKTTKHGMTGTRVYNIWKGIRDRCLNPKDTAFKYYGGRGITVCAEWSDFSVFYEDMGEDNGLTIDRIDNEKGYSKDNCRWATRAEQSRNRRAMNKFGIHGVRQRKTQNYHASIYANNKMIYLGTFNNFFDACCARKSAEITYWR